MKTAGTSLSNEFHKIYKDGYCLDKSYKIDRGPYGILDITTNSETVYPQRNFQKCNVIHGHFTVNKYNHLNWPTMTFLRHPVERVISHYSSANFFSTTPLPIEIFCEKTPNLMTKMTGGDLSRFFFVGIVEEYKESLRQLSKMIGHDLKITYINKTKRKIKFTKNQIKLVRKYNQRDLELYTRALNQFKRGY